MKKRIKIKKGFTLAEVMIALGIMGVIAAVTIPAMVKLRPNTTAIMFRKTYYTLEKAVSDLITDDVLYPELDKGNVTINGATVADQPLGFASDAVNVFCGNLVGELKTVGSNSCSDTSSNAVKVFTTSDGVDWYYKANSTFTANSLNYNYIGLDVNGTKSPNCSQTNNIGTAFTTDAAKATCTAPDRFEIGIRYDGKLTVVGATAQGYLTSITKNDK